MPAKGSGRGICLNKEGYLCVTRRGADRGRFAHRVYIEHLLGRALRMDEEVHHLCANRECWPPTDFHLVLMDSALHHASDAGRAPHWKRKAANGTEAIPF